MHTSYSQSNHYQHKQKDITMKFQEQQDLFTMLHSNEDLFLRDPENFIPYGVDMFTEEQKKIFDAEMDKIYRRYFE